MIVGYGKGRAFLVVAVNVALLSVEVGLAQEVADSPSGQQFLEEAPAKSHAHRAAPAKIATVEGITEYALDNGLRVLICPDPSRPTLTANMTYLVGSRHEGRGEAGMAHLLEHMLGKGTTAYPSIREVLADRGADFNASTWFDRTNFYETLPASDENLDFALHLEAERMIHSQISAEELAKEMTIISNEVELVENDPRTILSQRMMSTAYLWHNYGRTPIGNLSDIKRFPVETLRRFYRNYYQPDNATLVIAGRIDVDRTLELVGKHFGVIPRPTRVIDRAYTEEPTQDGPRRVSLQRNGDVAVAGLFYHVPAGAHPDAPTVQILQDVVTSEPSGRLYKGLVETGLATSVRGEDVMLLAEPGAIGVMVEVRLDQDIRQVQSQMIEIVEGLAEDGITAEEVERAKGRRLKKIRRTLADTADMAIELSEWIALGDWRTFFIHRDRLREVTVADVARVARDYLMESNRTAGLFKPTKEPRRAIVPPVPDVAAIASAYRSSATLDLGEAFVATPENIDERTLGFVLEPGMTIALLAKETRGDTVHAKFRFHFGDEQSLAGHEAALRLLPVLLQRGTTKRNHQQLRDEIDRLQSEIDVAGGVGTFTASIESDRAHIVPAIALLAEILQQPAFAPDQFEIVKRERLAQLEKELSSPQERCFNALRRALYPWPADSIHYIPTLEEHIEELNAISPDTIRELHSRFYGADHSEVAIVGDFDKGDVLKALAGNFGSWRSGYPYKRIAMPFRPIDARPRTIVTPDKAMAVVARGTQLEVRDDDPDYPALRFASYVLGESDKCRLYDRLRYKEALSYHVGAYIRADEQDRRASVFGYAFCSPDDAVTVLDAMRAEFDRWVADGVRADELAQGKRSYALEFQTRLADDEFVAGEIVEGLEIGRKLAHHAAMLEKIRALSEADIRSVLKKHLSDAPFVEIKAGDFR